MGPEGAALLAKLVESITKFARIDLAESLRLEAFGESLRVQINR
ncbi:hypothetical protein AKJ09_03342 [Labilithrix luteola]|uniref:Uncharacterized protein n=1 Tax=Labilithrix luteola TaxID=1391654 RepID=A0A0K1PT15_9BACT|nr:hypothetical protein AKJ09_03342 [Labilithrix luteola]